MSVIRVQKDSNYVVMNKTALRDKRLSWKAKGLHSYMLSMPDDWLFYDTELQKHASDGRDSLKSAIKELKDLGYMKRVKKRSDNGKFDYETLVYETPHTDLPLTDKPCTGKPLTENPQLLNNDVLSNKELNNDKYSADFETFWNLYPRKKEKKQAFTKFKGAIRNHSLDIILNGTMKYAQQVQKTEKTYIKHAATFLQNESFIDGFEEVEVKAIPHKEEQPPVLAGLWGEEE